MLVEKGNHQHFLPGEGSSQTVMEEPTPFVVTEPTGRQGSVSATAPGCSSCSHCSVCRLDIPLVHSSRDLSVKQTKGIYSSWRNQPRDAPSEQPEEAKREVWKLTQERQDGKRAALVACGGRCHQRGAHFASSKYWHDPMAWMGSSLGPAHVLAGLRCLMQTSCTHALQLDSPLLKIRSPSTWNIIFLFLLLGLSSTIAKVTLCGECLRCSDPQRGPEQPHQLDQ